MFSVIVPLFAQALTLTLAESTEVRARLEEEEEGDQPAHLDAYTAPSATLSLNDSRTAYALSYTPSFSLFDIGGEPSSSLLHAAYARAGSRFGLTSVGLEQAFVYGITNPRLAFAPYSPEEPEQGPSDDGTPGSDRPDLPGEPGTGAPEDGRAQGESVPFNEDLRVGAATTTLSLSHSLTRRWNLTESASYKYSTGFGDSQETYPTQQGADAGAAVTYGLSRYDSVGTSLSGSAYYTDPLETSTTQLKRRSLLAVLQFSWSRAWAEDFSMSLGVGATYTRTDEGDRLISEALVVGIGPAGSMTVDYSWGDGAARYTAVGTVGTAPFVDRYTGIVDPRLFWSASLARTAQRLTLTAALSGVQSTDPDSVTPLSTATGTLTADYQASDEFLLRAGISASTRVEISEEAVQDGNRPPPPLYFGFVGFTYTLRPINL